jgi:membrane protease YdiL (CAAX protease family)
LVPLQKQYSPILANIIISIVFVLVHLNQAWAPVVLLHIFVASLLMGVLAYASGSLLPGIIAHTILDIFNFSYWWSDVAGKFNFQPIGATGIDTHFLVWSIILTLSAALFFWGLGRVKTARLQS